jgi:hypothetical protein
LASPGAGDYPPDFLAHEIGPFRAVRRKTAHPEPVRTGSRRWTTHGSTDGEAAARRRYQVKVTTPDGPRVVYLPPARLQHPRQADFGAIAQELNERPRQTGFVPFAVLVRSWSPGDQRLIVASAAVHAARWTATQALTLDDLDLPNRRVTIASHPQRLGDLSHVALRGLAGLPPLTEIS